MLKLQTAAQMSLKRVNFARAGVSSALMAAFFALFTAMVSVAQAATADKKVDYNREVRPILSDHCYACHGPDANTRKASLRLDIREDAFKALEAGGFAIVAGNSKESQIIHRITTSDEDDLMPPSKGGKPLSKEQIATLTRWVEQGAEWKGHWAYQKPEQSEVPEIKNKSWARNPIDNFIAQKQEQNKFKPSPEASKNKLLRRATFDLTGLPPTTEEIDAFLNDKSPDAYDKVVDRLLKSPHYGERMAQFWLDLARYGETQGYHHDSHRDMFHWRDWVIKAFNDNKHYDDFTVEQLAGDLLPNPTREQLVATGFNRNEMTTSEGGADPNEYAVKYIVGRVDTTSRVWLGTSIACAECHDHKYDPISQKEFYQFFAYFNTVSENGMDQQSNPVPRVELNTPEQRARLEQLAKDATALESGHKSLIESIHAERDAAQTAWHDKLRQNAVEPWDVLKATTVSTTQGAKLTPQDDGAMLASEANVTNEVYELVFRTDKENITGLRLEALPDESLPNKRAGRGPNGEFVLSQFEGTAHRATPEDTATLDTPVLGNWYSVGPFKAGSMKEAFDKEFGPEKNVDFAQTFDEGKLKWQEQTNWVDGQAHELQGENAATYIFRTIKVQTPRLAMLSLGSDDGLQVWMNGRRVLAKDVARGVAADQDRALVQLVAGENRLLLKVNNGAAGYGFYFRLQPEAVNEHPLDFAGVAADYSQKDWSINGVTDGKPETGWAVGGDDAQAGAPHQAYFRTHDAFGFKGGTELRVRLKFESGQIGQTLGRFRLAVTSANGLTDFFALPENIRAIVSQATDARSTDQKLALQKYYRETYVPEVQQIAKLLETKRKEREDFQNSIPVAMTMQEMDKPRDTFLLVRGNFQIKGDKVSPAAPRNLFAANDELPGNRLGLAKWLVHPDNPLTSRVTVNHFWQQIFGTGIVKTAEDFGSQGEWPSHPELLDWLATEFVRSDWDVKAMMRLIVTSATYRQDSEVSDDLLEKDPDNRLLARFPRLRLEAEAVRDNAMAISGLLNAKIGGPSVYPYQPPGLWEAVAFEGTRAWEQSKGADNYRRGLYTYWRRSIPYASFVTFDAPTRETCTVRRPRTNTPLQALATMNDPVYVEASRSLASRILKDGGKEVADKLRYAFKVSLSRAPTKKELQILTATYHRELKQFEKDRPAANQLIHVGVSEPPNNADVCELATWTVIGNILLNLDEAINKG